MSDYLQWVEWGLEGSLGVFLNITMPLQAAITKIESNGISVDREYLLDLDAEYERRIVTLEREFAQHAGGVNYASPAQLSRFLFEDLGLTPVRMTKKGNPSTSLPVLHKLKNEHPSIQTLIGLKKAVKIKKNFLAGSGTSQGLLPWIRHDERVHTTFRVDGTETGRLSSTSPNLQNIAKEAEVRNIFGAPPGYSLIECDYSQMELRLAALLSGDKVMLGAFASGIDFHTMTAALMFKVDPSDVTPALRAKAKTVNFGVLYGMGPYALSFQLECTIEEAEEYIEAWFKTYRMVKRMIREITRNGRENGYVDNLFGRRRHLPGLKSPNKTSPDWKKHYAHDIRAATNFPIQSTGSDLLSMCTIQLTDYAPESLVSTGARPVLTLHDALYFECPDETAHDAAAVIKETMETIPKLLFGEKWVLPADAKVKKRWGDSDDDD